MASAMTIIHNDSHAVIYKFENACVCISRTFNELFKWNNQNKHSTVQAAHTDVADADECVSMFQRSLQY